MPSRDPRLGAFFDFSPRTKLRLTGADRIRFLNGQITNDVRKATESTAVAGCVLNAKGRMNAHVFLSVAGDAFMIDADAELRENLIQRLDRYIIADDVQVEDITDQFALFHFLAGPASDSLGRIVAADRFGQAGFDVWMDATRHNELLELPQPTTPFCDDRCAEVFRIEQGIPRWGRELTDEILPVEANLEQTCIDYEKGCYIGQEVVSRMKMSGQRNKTLCGLISIDNTPLEAGMKLYPIGAEKKEVGWITSATWSDQLGKQIALGYVKRGFNQPGAQLDALHPEDPAGSASLRVKVENLPFAIRSK
jgi:folate-binding protein YgfZ